MKALTGHITTQYTDKHTPETTSKRTKGLVEIPSTLLKHLCKSLFEKWNVTLMAIWQIKFTLPQPSNHPL